MPSICIPPSDPSYPPVLRELVTRDAPDPPTLYLRGALPSAPGIAVVGTRAASDGAIAFTRALAAALGAEGLAIWSGGARGVDAAAHQGALAAGAPTVLVAGGGLDRPYPPEHADLFERVLAAGGALLARVPDSAPPLPRNFLERNALLAAMTLATVVIEAGVESGARSTASIARRLGRPVLAVPNAPWDPRGAGCLAELALGALPVTDPAEVLAALGRGGSSARQWSGTLFPPPPPVRRRAHRPARPSAAALDPPGAPGADETPPTGEEPALGADERAVFAALSVRPAHLDEVCERTGLCPSRVAGALLTLTLHAVVVEGPAGSYRRARRSGP